MTRQALDVKVVSYKYQRMRQKKETNLVEDWMEVALGPRGSRGLGAETSNDDIDSGSCNSRPGTSSERRNDRTVVESGSG